MSHWNQMPKHKIHFSKFPFHPCFTKAETAASNRWGEDWGGRGLLQCGCSSRANLTLLPLHQHHTNLLLSYQQWPQHWNTRQAIATSAHQLLMPFNTSSGPFTTKKDDLPSLIHELNSLLVTFTQHAGDCWHRASCGIEVHLKVDSGPQVVLGSPLDKC